MVHMRERMVERGIAADALQPEWCHQNEALCYVKKTEKPETEEWYVLMLWIYITKILNFKRRIYWFFIVHHKLNIERVQGWIVF